LIARIMPGSTIQAYATFIWNTQAEFRKGRR
jgi:hypothetical protein